MATVYEMWAYKGATFELKTEDDEGIEDLRQAMIRQGASLVMRRVA